MAGKRSATSELNHENWNQDEEPEDAGTFQRASEDSLKRRIIKTARRRNPISSVRSEDPVKKSAFTGFTAFSKAALPATADFSFLSNITNETDKSKTNGANVNSGKSDSEKDNSTISVVAINKSSSVFESTVQSKESNGKSNNYFSKLKGLNESVSNWIKRHVDENPLINLQPIFKDYEKYFKELEKEESTTAELKNINRNSKNENLSSSNMFIFKAAENVPDSTTGKVHLESVSKDINKVTPKHSYGSDATFVGNSTPFSIGSTTKSNEFSFGSNISASTINTLTSSFSFGTNASTSSASGFSMSGSTPFTFSKVVHSSTGEPKKEEDTEEEEPPKVEFTPVLEKDYIFTTRCKVFVKKGDGNYGDRGIGNLYLKQIENSKKVQLIVRADTNLGNLLCNFILSECIPTKRIGKKDVMLVCLPTPDVKPPPVPILLRVKSPEEADNLLQVLEKHKK